MALLNPKLFRALERTFGRGNVLVVHEGQPATPTYRKKKVQNQYGKLRVRWQLVSTESDLGEEYQLRCPFCNDHKPRLYINHRWGVKDKRTGTRNWWLAHCWNEECLGDFENRRRLIEMVFKHGQVPSRLSREATRAGAPRDPYQKAEPPGPVWSLDRLARKQPQHEAVEYLEARCLDPDYLGRRFDCGYVLDSPYRFAEQRIYAPLYMDGKLVSWQCRFVGEPGKGTPKWFTMPGAKKRYHIYNFDLMRRHKTKIIVEGPSDTWNTGPAAGGLLGKKLSQTQAELIASACEDGDTVVLLLDPEQDSRETGRRQQHHIEQAYMLLRQFRRLRGKVTRVYLPLGLDPGSIDREYARDYITARAEEQKVPVYFGPPRAK